MAAALAWLVAQSLPGYAADHAYYAPLGAVVVVSSHLPRSFRASGETFLALGLGAALAAGVGFLSLPPVLSVGSVVLLGTLIGTWRWVGSMASWVPISAIFILVIGGEDPADYLLAYLGLTALGAVVGLAVNVLAPPRSHAAAQRAIHSLRAVLAEQLDGLADGLAADDLPTSPQWRANQPWVRSQSQRADEFLTETISSSRINWHVRRRPAQLDEQIRQARALRHLAFMTEEIVNLLAHQEHSEIEQVALGPELRGIAVPAFRAAAAALRSEPDSPTRQDELWVAEESLEQFSEEVRRRQREGVDLFAAASLALATRAVLDTMQR